MWMVVQDLKYAYLAGLKPDLSDDDSKAEESSKDFEETRDGLEDETEFQPDAGTTSSTSSTSTTTSTAALIPGISGEGTTTSISAPPGDITLSIEASSSSSGNLLFSIC